MHWMQHGPSRHAAWAVPSHASVSAPWGRGGARGGAGEQLRLGQREGARTGVKGWTRSSAVRHRSHTPTRTFLAHSASVGHQTLHPLLDE